MAPAESGTPVLVYDGACGFCTWCVEWLESHLRRPVFLQAYQRADLPRLGLAPEDAAASVWWIGPEGQRRHGHRAVACALERCGGAWRGLGRLLVAPGLSRLAGLAYGLVSRWRGHLPGRTPFLEQDGGPAAQDPPGGPGAGAVPGGPCRPTARG